MHSLAVDGMKSTTWRAKGSNSEGAGWGQGGVVGPLEADRNRHILFWASPMHSPVQRDANQPEQGFFDNLQRVHSTAGEVPHRTSAKCLKFTRPDIRQ